MIEVWGEALRTDADYNQATHHPNCAKDFGHCSLGGDVSVADRCDRWGRESEHLIKRESDDQQDKQQQTLRL